MSKLRSRLANDEQQPIDNVQEETLENVEDNNDIQEQIQEEVPQENVEQEEVQPVEEKEESTSVLDDYGMDYTNQWEKVTPFHVLFKDYGDEISKSAKDKAINICNEVVDELNNKYVGDENYAKPSPDAMSNFRSSLTEDTKNGMDVLFKVKDFLLASEGLSSTASLEDALINPKIAKRVALVFDTLIKSHNASKKK